MRYFRKLRASLGLAAGLVALSLVLGPSVRGQEKSPAKQPAPPRPQVVLETGGLTAPPALLFFTSDSKELIAVTPDETLRCWDVESGDLKRVLRLPFGRGPAHALAPDRKTLAFSDWHNLLLFNIEDGRIRSFPSAFNNAVTALSFSADGQRLAVGSNGHQAAVFDVASGKRLHIFNTGDHVQSAVGLSPDGQILTAFHEMPELLKLATNKADHIPMWKHDCFAWAPEGRVLAVGGGGGIAYFDPSTKKLLKQFPVGPTTSISFLPGGKELLTTGTMPKEIKSRVNILDADTGKELMRFTSPAPWLPHAAHADLSPDGRLVASSNGPGHVVYVWRKSDGKLLQSFRGRGVSFYAAAWREDGKAIAWGWLNQKGKDGLRTLANSFDLAELRFLGKPDPKDYRRRAVLKAGGTALVMDHIKTVTRDGKNFHLRTDEDGPLLGTLLPNDRVALAKGPWLYLYDLNSRSYFDKKNNRFMIGDGERLWVYAVNDEVTEIAPSPDNKYVLTASRDQVLRIWRVEPKRLALHVSLFVAGQDWIAWTPEGYYAATPGGERFMGWAVNNGRNKLMTYYPADRFRKQLYRPDVLKLVMEKGSLREALTAANAARKKEGETEATKVADVEELLPPRVVLQIGDRKGDQVKVKATATAAAPKQPVMAMRLLVDGRPLADRSCTLNLEEGKDKAEAEWTVTIPEGKHTLAVLARSPDASAISRPIEVAYTDTNKLPVLHVLTIGVSAYEDKSLKLDFAAKDARDLASQFQKCGKGGLYREVVAQTLTDGEANREAILKAVDGLRKQVKPNDLAVVFFAGHGVKGKDQFYLLSVEAKTDDLAKTAVSGADLRKALGEFPCQVLLMLDACHSSGSLKSFRPAVDDATRAMTDDDCGVAVLCSAMASEKALERDGNGLFTRALVDALGGSPGVPFNPVNRRMYVHHLHTYILDRVSAESEDRQHPFLSLPWVVQSFPVNQLGTK